MYGLRADDGHMTVNLYKDEAIIRNVSYSASGGHKVTLEVDPEGWEALKAAGVSTRCAMVLVEIDNNDAPVDQPRKPKSRAEMAGILCNDERFWEYILHPAAPRTSQSAVEAVRSYCGVTTRTKLNTDPAAAAKWEELANGFKAYIGQVGTP